MEIAKMLTVSTAHITKETAALLTKICDGAKESDLIVYPKKDSYDYHGWFIYCNVCKTGLGIPSDLIQLMCFTSDSGIDWLCLDRDGEIVDNEHLKTYDW